jgi:hypothetical protein
LLIVINFNNLEQRIAPKGISEFIHDVLLVSGRVSMVGLLTALPSIPSSSLVVCLFMDASKLQVLVLANYLREYLRR